MNQLELLASFNKQVVRDRIADSNAVHLGDVYIYFNQMYYTIRTTDKSDNIRFMAIEELDFVLTKEYMLEYIRCHFLAANTISIIGFDGIYLDGNSHIDEKTLSVFERLKTLFISLQSEYDEFVDYLNYHLDEIVANGGKY